MYDRKEAVYYCVQKIGHKFISIYDVDLYGKLNKYMCYEERLKCFSFFIHSRYQKLRLVSKSWNDLISDDNFKARIDKLINEEFRFFQKEFMLIHSLAVARIHDNLSSDEPAPLWLTIDLKILKNLMRHMYIWYHARMNPSLSKALRIVKTCHTLKINFLLYDVDLLQNIRCHLLEVKINHKNWFEFLKVEQYLHYRKFDIELDLEGMSEKSLKVFTSFLIRNNRIHLLRLRFSPMINAKTFKQGSALTDFFTSLKVAYHLEFYDVSSKKQIEWIFKHCPILDSLKIFDLTCRNEKYREFSSKLYIRNLFKFPSLKNYPGFFDYKILNENTLSVFQSLLQLQKSITSHRVVMNVILGCEFEELLTRILQSSTKRFSFSGIVKNKKKSIAEIIRKFGPESCLCDLYLSGVVESDQEFLEIIDALLAANLTLSSLIIHGHISNNAMIVAGNILSSHPLKPFQILFGSIRNKRSN